MSQLREATWPQHQHAEARPLEQALAKGKLSREGYIALLEQRLLIHDALEQAWISVGKQDSRITSLVADELLQVENLRSDLKYFNRDLSQIAPLPGTAALNDDIRTAASEQPISILGHYYVFEGSKNGGRMMAKGLRQIYELPERDGTRYFDPHGEQQRDLWQAFKFQVDAIIFNTEERNQIIQAAQCTFDHVSTIDDQLFAQLTSRV